MTEEVRAWLNEVITAQCVVASADGDELVARLGGDLWEASELVADAHWRLEEARAVIRAYLREARAD